MWREDMDQTKPETPYVRQLPLGPMKNFVYLVGAPRGRQAFVIDPAWDAQAIHSALLADGRELVGIFLTHHHHDHLPVYVQKAELDFATEALKPFAGAVRAVGVQKPSKVNEKAFDRAVEKVMKATTELFDALEVHGLPKDRDEEKRKAHERGLKRDRQLRARLLATR